MMTARIHDAPPGTQLIVDPNTQKVRNARDIRVAHYRLPIPGVPGQTHTKKCVRYTIVGRRHTWDNYAVYEVFMAYNPNVVPEEPDGEESK